MPSVIQVIHVFENHSHEVCVSVDEHHFHEQELNCSLADYQFEVFSIDFNSSFELTPIIHFKSRFKLQPQFIPVHHIVKPLPRGPPFNLV